MLIQIQGLNPPPSRCGPHENIHVGVQSGLEVIQVHGLSQGAITWMLEVKPVQEPEGGIDFRGPYVHGRKGDRFLYLSWGTLDRGGTFTMFRRAKLLFRDVPQEVLNSTLRSDHPLIATLSLTAPDGSPTCGAVRPPDVEWLLEPATVA